MTPERPLDALPEEVRLDESRPADAPPSGAPGAAAPVGRRDLIKAGWAVPVALMVGAQGIAQAEPSPTPTPRPAPPPRPATGKKAPNPQTYDQMVRRAMLAALGAARLELRDRHPNPVDDQNPDPTTGLTALDTYPIAIVVITHHTGKASRAMSQGYLLENDRAQALYEARKLAIQAWRNPNVPPPDGGGVLRPKGTGQSIEAAVGVIYGGRLDVPTITGSAKAAKAAMERVRLGGAIPEMTRVRSAETSGDSETKKGSEGGGQASREDAKFIYANARTAADETMNDDDFGMANGVIVIIDEDEDAAIVDWINDPTGQHELTAQGRASQALASPGNPPFGGRPLEGATDGAVGIFKSGYLAPNADAIAVKIQTKYDDLTP